MIKKKILEDVDLKKWVYSEKAELKRQQIEEEKHKGFRELKSNTFDKEGLVPKKIDSEDSKASSWTDRIYKCSECGKETSDWFKCDTGKMTCVCRDCHYKS